MNIHELLRTAESVRVVDKPAERSARLVNRVLAGRRLGAALRGSWLGHPVHPILVTVPLGAWMSSAVFDIGFHDQKTARRLLGLGLAVVPPTALTGLADFASLHREQRRVGALHALVNLVGIAMLAMSFRCHGRQRHRSATVYTVLGLMFIGVGGALGGHLSYAQGAGVHRWEGVRSAGDLLDDAAGRAA